MMARKPPRYDLPKAAPEPLRVVQLLVNTRDHEHGRELLASEEDLRRWLAERNLPLEGALLPRFQALREALRALLIANNEGAAPPSAALASLNAEARRSPLRARFDVVGARLQAEDAAGAILAAAFEAMADGTWPRLKACRNCHWAFYDESRNRSGTWCSMQLCGNRLKTRRFRTRHAPA